MIISNIIGGLGNQMFQYAMGRALATRLQAEFKIDVTGFAHYPLHKYSLPFLNITAREANKEEIEVLRGKSLPNGVIGRMLGLLSHPKTSYVKEPLFTFSQNMFDLGDKVYLEGYWQTEKYFSDVSGLIRKEFSFKPEPDEANKRMLSKIFSSNAIAVHVRRGDYVTNTQTNQFHGTTTQSYYQRAVDLMVNQVTSPTLFFFSDDPGWVKENLKFSVPSVYVTHNGADKNYEDLRLMSSCQHHIIANSSFSWWGAWLGEKPGQHVIAPQRWFNTDQNTSDLIPERWVRI